MAQVQKANRVITVPSERVGDYLKRGYDQIDKNGKVSKKATGGKKISAAKFNDLQDSFDQLSQEHKELEKRAKEFADKGKALQAENDKLKKSK